MNSINHFFGSVKKCIIISRSQSLTSLLHLKEGATCQDPVPCEAALTTGPICVLIMSDQLVGDLPHLLFSAVLPRRMSSSRFSTSLQVTWQKYPRMRLSHKVLDLTGFCISLTIEMLVCRAIQGILNILHQTHISKASIFLLSSAFNVHVSTLHKKTEKTNHLLRW